MKKTVIILFAILALASCTNQEKGTSDDSSQAICIWDKASLRDGPTGGSKWLTSISLGEKITLLGETKVDSTDKNKEYTLVKLSDGKEGWVSSYLIIPNGKLVAITEKSTIYTRPNLLNTSDENFDEMEIAVVISESEEFVEVTGNQKKKSGWIKKANITDSTLDVSFAVLATKALLIDDYQKKSEKINEILDNPDLHGSTFYSALKKKLDPFEVKNVVKVNTVTEFLEAIAPNTKIEVLADELHITEVELFISKYVDFSEPELVIDSVNNLIISGANSNRSKILSNEVYAWVLSFSNCNNIALSNLSIGHSVPPDECSAGVVHFSTCTDLFISECDLFGSGTVGLEVSDVRNLVFENSMIKECSEGIITANNSSNLKFNESVFTDNNGYDLLYFVDCNNVLFESAQITDNKSYVGDYYGEETSLFYLEGYTSVKVTNSEIFNNELPVFQNGEGVVDMIETETGGNQWEMEDEYAEEGEY